MTGVTQDLPIPTRLLYWLSQTCRMFLLPILLVSSDAATAETFAPPYLGIVFRNGHENMVLHATPYPKLRETVTGIKHTTKGVL